MNIDDKTRNIGCAVVILIGAFLAALWIVARAV